MILPHRLVWIDLETTGLSPQADFPLEIAVVITDNRLRELHSYDMVIRCHRDPKLWHPTVQEMHTANGLITEMRYGAPLAAVEEDVRRMVVNAGAGGGPICGSTPQFDRGFLAEWMPSVERLFNHRVFDVSSLTLGRLIKDGLSDSGKDAPAHRALPDIRYSIAKARELLGLSEVAA